MSGASERASEWPSTYVSGLYQTTVHRPDSGSIPPFLFSPLLSLNQSSFLLLRGSLFFCVILIGRCSSSTSTSRVVWSCNSNNNDRLRLSVMDIFIWIFLRIRNFLLLRIWLQRRLGACQSLFQFASRHFGFRVSITMIKTYEITSQSLS